MNSYKSQIINAFKIFFIFTVLCGVIYTAIVTGIAQGLFPKQANGSMITQNGKIIGSELIAQPFTSDKYMWGRSINPNFNMFGYDKKNPVYYAGPTNISPSSKEFENAVKERIKYLQNTNPEMNNVAIPEDLVTVSGSGQDPDISYSAALYQAKRIAKNNNISLKDVNLLIKKCTHDKFLGIMGEKTVNVLKFNIMLNNLLGK